MGSTPGSGRSHRGGNGYPLQYSCLENPMDRGAWQATVHEFAQSRTRLYLTTVLGGLSCELSAANTPGSWKDECLSPGGEAGLCTTASTAERSFKDGRNTSMFRSWEEESS